MTRWTGVFEQRKLTEVLDGGERNPEYGLLPAGRLEDSTDSGELVLGERVLPRWDDSACAGISRCGHARSPPLCSGNGGLSAETSARRRAPCFTVCTGYPAPRQFLHSLGAFQASPAVQAVGACARRSHRSCYKERVLPCFRSSGTRAGFVSPIQLLVFGHFVTTSRLQIGCWTTGKTT